MTTAREIMSTEPRIVSDETPVTDVAKMFDQDGIGAVIVCNDERRLQGVITDRDIATEVVARDRNPVATLASELVDGREVVTIGADDSADLAIRTMKEHAVRRLPVIDGADVVGMISQADVATIVPESQVGELLKEVSAAPDNTGRG